MGGDGDTKDGGTDLLKAYENLEFIHSRDGRTIRLLAEYLEPEVRFRELNIADTIVFFGSARTLDRETAELQLQDAKSSGSGVEAAEKTLEMSAYYEAARELAHKMTEWSKTLEGSKKRFVVCTGGGPGIMEAANRGASEAKGINVGLNISLPHEQHYNPYITRELNFEFHYFFMRKFWFTYLAKAIIVFPGGFGTMDELFENLTLVQTHKLLKPIPIVLFGTSYWDKVFELQAMADAGTIAPDDVDLYFPTDSVDEAFDFLTRELLQHALTEPSVLL